MSRLTINIFLLLITLLLGCAHDHEGHDHDDHSDHSDHDDHDDHDNHDNHEEASDGTVIFTAAQIAAIDLQLGTFTEAKLSGYLMANGTLETSPANHAAVHAPQAGFVGKVRYLEGSFVKKGATLVELSHPDFLLTQQEYLEVISQLTFLKQELTRQQTLAAANVSAQKKLQETESSYNVFMAKKKGLAARMAYLGINVAKLEAGTIQSTIPIRSPLSGHITQMQVHEGQFVNPETKLYEIVDDRKLLLKLNIFEKDLAKVEKGQRLSFTLPAHGSQSYEGSVYLIGKEFDEAHRTICVYGQIEGVHPEFIRGLYVQAKIWLDAPTAKALPEEAVVMDGGMAYIFVETAVDSAHEGHDEKAFQKVLVRTGATENGFTEVHPVEILADEAKIVVTGAYFLLAEMKKGEVGHGHAH